jgi:hypothetical protein
LVWTPVLSATGDFWEHQVVVTVSADYEGPLTNAVRATSLHGASDAYTETSYAIIETPNRAPYVPGSPDPADLSTNVPLTQTLMWRGGDPDGDVVTYSVSFGSAHPPPLVAVTALTSYVPSLISDTAYSWMVTAADGISVSVGPLWRFVTVGPFQYWVYLPLSVK